MASTADYTRRAIDKYRAKFDIIQIKAPKGTKKRITTLSGQSMEALCLKCVLDRLDELESEARKEAAANEMPTEPEPVQEEEPEQIGFTAARMLDIIRGGGSLPEDPEKEAARAVSKSQECAEI